MKVWLAGVCILFISLSVVLAFKCQECADFAGFPSASSCTSQEAKSMECSPYFDSCMTVKFTMQFSSDQAPINSEMRNCSSRSMFCDEKSDLNMCKLVNSSGMVTKCSEVCCEGDMCNKVPARPWSLRGLLPGLN